MTHDYGPQRQPQPVRAFDLAQRLGSIAQPYRQHRHQEFLKFLKLIDKARPEGPSACTWSWITTPTHKNSRDQGVGC